jgi:hypothetical protein
MMVRKITITGGQVSRHGVHTPKGTRVVKREGSILTVKVPGSSYWVGLNLPEGYDPAHYEVYKVQEDRGGGRFQVLLLTSFPVRN